MVTVKNGTRIRLIRTLLEMEQLQFARLTKINQSRLSRVESGRLTPTEKDIGKIRDNLGISLDDPRIETFFSIKEAIKDSIAA
jgi:transcriptional regulator with XRE-family HTH domain